MTNKQTATGRSIFEH